MTTSAGQVCYEAFTAHDRKQHSLQPEFPRPKTWEKLPPKERDRWAAGAASALRSVRASDLEKRTIERAAEDKRQLEAAQAKVNTQELRAQAAESDLAIARQRASETEARLQAKLRAAESKLKKKGQKDG